MDCCSGGENWKVNVKKRVCARHFIESDFRKDARNIADDIVDTLLFSRNYLVPTAISSVNLAPQEGELFVTYRTVHLSKYTFVTYLL